MNLQKTLETVGFNEKEASVYIAALKSGPETATAIAKASGIKRTTVYFILEQLISRGVIGMKQTRSTTFYSAISPHRLVSIFNERDKILENALPEFEKIYKSQMHKPQVQVFEGVEGVRQIYQEVEQFVRRPSEVLYFGSIEHYLKDEYKDIFEWWIKLMKSRSHQAREILDSENTLKPKYMEEIIKNANPYHQIKLAPKTIHFSDNDNLIYGNKIAIFSHLKEVFVVVIESESIANSFRSFFDMAWRNAKAPKFRAAKALKDAVK